MELGDKVIYYTHEASDDVHSTHDVLAFVTGIVDDKTIDVVAFPPGGPVAFYRASLFDSANPALVVGLTYWRPVGSAAPDFASAFIPLASTEVDADEASRLALADKQKAEIAKVDRAGYETLRVTQAKEWDDLEASIAAKHLVPEIPPPAPSFRSPSPLVGGQI